jgi:hypothetical protein
VQADAGKTRGPIEGLLVEHRQIRQNARAVGKPPRLVSRLQPVPISQFVLVLVLVLELGPGVWRPWGYQLAR